MKPREIRIPALDGLRGVAIALVLFWHFILCSIPCTGGTAFGYFNKLFRHSYSGVDLFFVLSGFLITQILLRDVGSKDWLKRFWIRRAFRILPLYFLFLLAAMIFSLMGNPAQGGYFTTPHPIWPYLLMLQNIEMARQRSLGTWGVTWSLAVEEQFYLFYPLFVSARWIRRHLPIVAIAALVLSWILRLHGEFPQSFVLTLYRLDGFAGGATVAWISTNKNLMRWLASKVYLPWAFTLTGLLLFALITIRKEAMLPIDHVVFAYAYSAIVLQCILGRADIVTNILRNPILRWLGFISYPLYLFHPMCEQLVRLCLPAIGRSFVAQIGQAIAGIGISLIVAEVLNRWFGNPLLAIGRKWSNRLVFNHSEEFVKSA